MPIIKYAIGRELEGEFAAARRAGVWIDAARIIQHTAHNCDIGRELEARLGRPAGGIVHVVEVEEVQNRIDDRLRHISGQINPRTIFCVERSRHGSVRNLEALISVCWIRGRARSGRRRRTRIRLECDKPTLGAPGKRRCYQTNRHRRHRVRRTRSCERRLRSVNCNEDYHLDAGLAEYTVATCQNSFRTPQPTSLRVSFSP